MYPNSLIRFIILWPNRPKTLKSVYGGCPDETRWISPDNAVLPWVHNPWQDVPLFQALVSAVALEDLFLFGNHDL